MASTTYNAYPIFEKNQVLTNTQLNQLVSYLEEQGRLTRSSLIGIGVLCGLETRFVPESDSDLGVDTLYISEGVGVTSEGFLIQFCGCPITSYRNYVMNPYIDYPPFQNPATKQQDIVMQELLTDDFEADGSEEPIVQIDQSIFENKVVVLYLECYDKDLKSCLTKSCDDIGIERKFTLRKLLISISDIENKVLPRTENEDVMLYPDRYRLPDIGVKLPLFSPPVADYDTFAKIAAPYGNVLFSAAQNPVLAILNAWKDAYEAFAPILRESLPANPFADPVAMANAWKAIFDGSGSAPKYMGIQYYYDFIKDLFVSYSEFREVSFDLLTRCCPDEKKFPKHLMLGEVTTDCIPSAYRQQFMHSPAKATFGKLLLETQTLFYRVERMVKAFDTDRVNKTESYDPLKVKVTPSDEKKSWLTQRAIPYYFRTKINGKFGSLEALWDYDIKRRCAVGDGLLAYANNYDDISGGPATETKVSKPLQFNRDPYGFYRIEGGLGKSCAEVIDLLEEKIHKYNLPFDVVAVRVNNATAPVVPASLEDMPVDYNCGFHDLHEDYISCRYQIVNMLKFGPTVWDLYKRIEEIAKENDKDFEEPINDEVRKIIEEVYKGIVTFICKTLPPCLPDFAASFEELKDRYADAIVFVTDKVFEHLDLNDVDEGAQEVDNVTGIDIAQEVIAEATHVVYQFFDMLFFNRLYRIYYAFRRREYYYSLQFNKHSQTFSEYIAKHPGIEHMAGTPSGGTFVIVYGNFLGMNQRVLADFSLPYRCCDDHRCIPVCDDAIAKEHIMVAPYARPDYGYTFENVSITMPLVINDHNLHDLEKEFCVKEVEETWNVFIVGVKPLDDNQPQLQISKDKRSVLFTPPKDFTGIVKYSYTLENINNGLRDTGVVTVLVREMCVRLPSFEFAVKEGDHVVASLKDNPGFTFNDPDVNQEIVSIENGGVELHMFVNQSIQDPYTFKYTAKGDKNDGCGKITLRPTGNGEPFIPDQDFSISLNSPKGTIVGTVEASDPDNEPLTFSFFTGRTDIFAINPQTGEIQIINPDSMEPIPYEMGVRVTDPLGLFDEAFVVITVFDENKAPNIGNQSVEIPVTIAVGTVVTTMEASDPDGDPLTFSIVSGNTGNAFRIVANTGQIVVASNTNFPNSQGFQLGIRVTDPSGLFAQAFLNISLLRGNEPPFVNIAQPKTNQIFPVGSAIDVVFITGDDTGVAKVEVLLNGQLHGVTTKEQNFGYVMEGLKAGSYRLQGRAVDLDGAMASSQIVDFQIQGETTPTITLTDNLLFLNRNELSALMESRQLKVTTADTRETLSKKLQEGLKTQPLTRKEVASLSDETLFKLAEQLGVDASLNRSDMVDALFKRK
ncbi:MAG: cadherin domain-containing protein [Flavobacteriales bacterium]|nr:cadherin domain-containing protein [Flavobacteriales bacterium]